MTRPAPGVAATSSSTPVATSSHSRAPTGSGNQISSACRCLSCTSAPSRHSLRGLAVRAPRFARRLRTRDTPAGDVQLVDRVERADRVPGEHVGEAGREPAARDDARAVRAGVGVEREQRAERRVAVGARRVRDARGDGAARQRGIDVAREAPTRWRRVRRAAGRRARAAAARRRRAARAATSRACSRRRAATITRSTPGVSMSWRAVRTPTSPSPATRTVLTQTGSPEVGALQLAPPAAAGRRHRALAADPHHDARPRRRSRPRGGRAGRPSCDGRVYRRCAQTAQSGSPKWPAGVRRSIDRAPPSRRPAGSTRRRSRRARRRTTSATRGSPWSGSTGWRTCTRTARPAAPPGRRRRTPRPGARGSRPTRSTPRRRTTSSANGSTGSALRSCTTVSCRLRVAASSAAFMPEHGEVGAAHCVEVRHPRAHEVEHVTVEAELVVERPDRGDGAVVDVGDEPQRPVELGVGARIGPVEEPGWEGHAVGLAGIEPATSSLSGMRSNRLSYSPGERPSVAKDPGVRPSVTARIRPRRS